MPSVRPGGERDAAHRRALAWLCTLALVLLALPFLLPAMPQPQHYHDFADRRGWLGIPNFGDVVSNAAFLFAALAGAWAMRGERFRAMPAAPRRAYRTMFAGLALTAFGSAWYHWAPSDARLVWDRLPMTLVFMPLLAATLAERLHWRSDLPLVALCLLGVASVAGWKFGGNLTPYLVAQVGAILLLLACVLLLPSQWTGRGALFAAMGWYLVAFLCERGDHAVFAFTRGMVSGHTCKHIAAALALYCVAAMLRRQQLRMERA